MGESVEMPLPPGARPRRYVPVIEAHSIWKQYRRPHVKASTLKEAIIALLQGKRGYDEFWALRDIAFSMEKGEAVGLVGANGSGKSTLLGILARVLRPTRGSVAVNGRVCPLLELGTGFHPDLTGRENVFLNSSLLGLSHKETAARYDDIVDFAELHDFMAAPVKTFSTGMVVRLGFSVAAHMDPDILLVDEILGVGDEHFRHKSFARMVELKQQGKTICVVSHNLDSIELFCKRAIWIDAGRLIADGEVSDVVAQYRAAVDWYEQQLAQRQAPTSPLGSLP